MVILIMMTWSRTEQLHKEQRVHINWVGLGLMSFSDSVKMPMVVVWLLPIGLLALIYRALLVACQEC